MGVIRPPWITKEWFAQCPFNYCDHFGEKELLATVCKICREEVDRIERYRKLGEDPYDMNNVFADIGNDFTRTMAMVTRHAEEMGIDLENMPDPPEAPLSEMFPIFQTVQKYGDRIQSIIDALSAVPIETNNEIVLQAVDALSHSRHYIGAKIGRALRSQWEEKQDPHDDLFDSKTSAFFAYVAIERNSRALLSLARHKPLSHLKKEHTKVAKMSLILCELIQEQFFPEDILVYQEFGRIEYE